jgi:hypothetical protein
MHPPRLHCLLLLLATTACSSVSHSPEVAERVARIDHERLAGHVEALAAIGPRPKGDEQATRATVDYITGVLEADGYRVTEVRFETLRPGRFVARLRPADDPDAEPQERELPEDLATAGSLAIAGTSRRLRDEGWQVLGYSLRPVGERRTVMVPNLFAELRGARQPDRIIEVSAHYDTVPFSPGADDNSSGVAALLEVARVLADARPAKTIRFCFFGAEESGLLGSAAHLQDLLADDSQTVEGLLNLDGVGFATDEPDSQRAPVRIPIVAWMPTTGNFITVIGNWSSGWLGNLYEDAADVYVPELRYFSANRIGGMFDDARRSDHAVYWDAGYDAIFLADTTEFRTDTYHQPTDTPDTLDHVFLRRVTQATAATLLEWADG